MGFPRELIEQIVLEVVREIDTRPIQLAKYKKNSLLLIFTEQRPQQEVEEIVNMYKGKWEVMTWFTVEEGKVKQPFPPSISKAIFVDVNQDLLLRGALGFTDTPVSKALAQLLHQDIPIILALSKELNWLLVKEGKHPLSAGVKCYREHIAKQKEKLETYGIMCLSHQELWQSELVDSIQHDKYSTHEEVVSFEKKLLTEKDIHALNANVILVSEKTMITPLARDIVKSKGIVIRVQ